MKIAIRIILFCTIFSGTSCFKIRTVEAPQIQTQSDWTSPVEYTQLLDNFSVALSLLNSQNYLRCMSKEGFKFIPSAGSVSGNQLIWDNWSVNDEREYLENMASDLLPGSSVSLILIPDGVQFLSADSIRYNAEYKLRVPLKDSVLPDLFNGKLELIMVRNASREWEIRNWSDFETAKDSSWSRLKLNLVL